MPIVKEGVNDLRLKDYQGARKAGAIVSHVAELIPNHVTRITDAKFDDFLSENNGTAKAILFTNKGATTPLWKALAIDYLGVMGFAQIRDKEKHAVETFRITKYPTVVLLPGGDAEGIVYEGSGFSKDALLKFFQAIVPLTEEASSSAEPNGEGTLSSTQESKTATVKETPTLKRKCHPSTYPSTQFLQKSNPSSQQNPQSPPSKTKTPSPPLVSNQSQRPASWQSSLLQRLPTSSPKSTANSSPAVPPALSKSTFSQLNLPMPRNSPRSYLWLAVGQGWLR